MNTIETSVRDYLVSKNIFPFSVVYIKSVPLLKISFHLQDDVHEFSEISGCGKICDNSGYVEYEDTVVISGICLDTFLRNVGC